MLCRSLVSALALAVFALSAGDAHAAAYSIDFAPASPLPGQDVTFHAVRTNPGNGESDAFLWTFSDGTTTTTSTEPDPVRQFAAGTYTVTLSLGDSQASELQDSRTVVVNTPPSAAFTFDPLSPVAGESVTFTGGGTDPDGDAITSWSWDFGDGVPVLGQTVSRSFPAAASYEVKLTVTDSHGATSAPASNIVVVQPADTGTGGGGTGGGTGGTGGGVGTGFDSRGTVGGGTTGGGTTGGGGTRRIAALRMMRPRPIVRIAGMLLARGARVRLLSLVAPVGVKVLVRCRGRGCPARSLARTTKRRVVRFHRFERLLPAGVTLEFFVRRTGRIGKYSRIRIRAGRPPLRVDRCLVPGRLRPVRCPS